MIFDGFILQLRDTNCPFLTEKNQVRVQIEWEDSYLLFQATYHKYDDVIRLHNQQMRYVLRDAEGKYWICVDFC